ncbi:amidohydrolase family protein [Paracnuella aquatica]|uniref:amidohydrolase family protein n=1 Tax=Paracnuella aquatica TaxID=2268757 RepID=UPI0019D4C793|nr:amidohydrolase family protein [Paracnuella aquatica]
MKPRLCLMPAALYLLIFASFFHSKLFAQIPPVPPVQELVFRSVNVIPMDGEIVLPNQTVVVRNGVIHAMGDEGKVQWGKDAKVIDGKGKYLMPGLAEMHAHVPPSDDVEAMKEVLLLFAVNGITTIRGMLGHPRHLELRASIQNGSVIGPTFFTSGPSFNGNSAPTPQAAAQLVRDQKAAGYDFLKIHPGIKLDAFKAMAATAKELNIPFAGHVPSDVGIWNAIEMGILTIDHLDGFVEALIPGKEQFAEGSHGLFATNIFEEANKTHIQKLMDALKKKGTWVVPTQALAVRWLSPQQNAAQRAAEPEMKYMSPKTVANWVRTKQSMEEGAGYNREAMPQYIALRNELIKACQDAGVPLLLGSDAPQVFNVPGFSTHHELRYLVDAGLTRYQALYSGTVAVGKFYGKREWGTIQRGAPADLILLEGNPLQNIEHIKNIDGVVLKGKWLDNSWREAVLKAIADKKRKEESLP